MDMAKKGELTEDTHLNAYLLLVRKRQILYPSAYNQKINMMCPYLYTQLKIIYIEKYQPNDMEIKPLKGFPFKNIDFGEDLVETYLTGDCSAYTLGIIEYLLMGQKIKYIDFDIKRYRLQMTLDIYVNLVEVHDREE
ncbi:hypothetical protein ACOSP7_014129 [Xanthoceras sorbifolium]